MWWTFVTLQNTHLQLSLLELQTSLMQYVGTHHSLIAQRMLHPLL